MSTRTRRAAGLGGILGTIAVIVGLKAASAPSPVHLVVTPHPSAAAPPTTGAPSTPGGPSSTTASPSAPAPPTTTARPQQVIGSAESNPYGTVQVRLTLLGRRIVDVTTVQVPNDRGRSVEIAREAIPLLRQEVLKAQSAQIDAVSGASYDSQGYAQSVQAALDRARQ